MTTIIENTAKLWQSTEIRLGSCYIEPYSIWDTEEITRLKVREALRYSSIIKLQLRVLATKEAPPESHDIPSNGPPIMCELMYVHKRKRKITRNNSDAEVSEATKDLVCAALGPIYKNGELRTFGYFSKLFIDIYETTPEIALDYNAQSNAIKSLPTELQNKIFYHLRHPIAEIQGIPRLHSSFGR